ncbi:MAG: beta-lactamase family protein [Acidobacteria bacterium]|jgi:CubicO group peptidase (beta-lactamase class C family)|nr:beta-lactamase family protein [Acidobacteriota bacterium]
MPIRMLLVSLLLVAAAPALAQTPAGSFTDAPALPDSPAGRRTRELLDALNGSDEAALRRFVEQAFSPSYDASMTLDDHLDFFHGIQNAHGRLNFVASRTLEPNPLPGSSIAIVRSSRSDRWLGVLIGVESAPPHRITNLMINTARPPQGAVATAPLAPAGIAEPMRAHLAKLAASDAFSGTVLIAVGGEVVFEGAYGEADREGHVANTLDTRFGLSSMGKMFTAVAIAQLVDAGKLSFDDRLSRVLGEDWLPAGAKDSLTIRHLLSHTGGAGDFLGVAVQPENRGKYLEVSDYKPVVAGRPLDFPPGTRFQYSNSGFILLGAVIEKVSGKRYEDYVRGAIWGPAGMTATGCLDRDAPQTQTAIGYYQDGPKGQSTWLSNRSLAPRRGSPAGGCFSTVRDLFRFARALQGGRLVKPATLAEMWREQSPPGSAMRYGLGFILEDWPSGRAVGHGGTFPGANGAFDIYVDRNATVIVLCNGDGIGSARDKARELVLRLPAATTRPPG